MTLSKAWRQTFKKWEEIIENPTMPETACGLCDYDKSNGNDDCTICPIYKTTGERCNVPPYILFFINPTTENALLEYDFLWSVYYATHQEEL